MLQLQNIYKVYENGTLAVRNVSLGFPSCGMVAIVGKSGSGKSTLLNLLANNDKPNKGNILYNGKSYEEVGQEVLIKDFAYIYQDYKLIDNLTVYQNIKIGHELANKDIDNEYILKVADELGLTQLLDEKVYALSGGQMQRVAIARALVRNPKVIFADEPTGNLDSKNSKNVYNILKKLSKEKLVIVVSHDKRITEWSDIVISMENGKVVDDNEIQQEKQNEQQKLDNLEEVSLKQKEQVKSKKQTKIGTKSIFSYTKGKNKTRKKQGLSANSLLGLTIAFNNKGIGKKVGLSIICIFMIALILVSTAMIFSTYEKTFCMNMLKNKVPYVVLNTNISLNNAAITSEHEKQMKNYIESKYKTNVGVEAQDVLINGYFVQYSAKDKEKLPEAFKNYSMPRCALFIDNPSDLGIEMIIGSAPKNIYEIAISKTTYNYILFAQQLESFEDIVEFNNRDDLIGKFIKEWNLTITGVFEDNFRYSNVQELPKDLDIDFRLEQDNNFLYNKIILPTIYQNYLKNFYHMRSTNYAITFDVNCSVWNGFSGYLPANEITKNYYFKDTDFPDFLQEDEVIIRNIIFVEQYEKMYNRKLQLNDYIDLHFVEVKNGFGSAQWVTEKYHTKRFKVVGLPRSNSDTKQIIINDKVYQDFYIESNKQGKSYWIGSQVVNDRFMKDINNFMSDIVGDSNVDEEKVHLRWSMEKFEGLDSSLSEMIMVANTYVAIPLFVLSFFVFSVVLGVILTDLLKAKGTEVLILKALGANNFETIKIFSLGIVFISVLQFVLGLILGFGLLGSLNILWAKIVDSYNYYFDTFWLGAENIILTITSILVIVVMVLYFGLTKLSGKNLRKSFQKQKK